MLAALGREDDMPKLLDLRQLAEIEYSHGSRSEATPSGLRQIPHRTQPVGAT